MRATAPIRSALVGAALAAAALLASAGGALASAAHDGPTGVRLDALYALERHDGGRLARPDVRGRPFVLVFGYTHCPEVCPTSLLDVSSLLDALGEEGARLGAYFVTIDPERDTVETLDDYLGAFHPRIVGLTGAPPAVAETADAFGATAARRPVGDTYAMDHSASFYFVDRYGLLARIVPYADREGARDAALRLLAQ